MIFYLLGLATTPIETPSIPSQVYSTESESTRHSTSTETTAKSEIRFIEQQKENDNEEKWATKTRVGLIVVGAVLLLILCVGALIAYFR